MILVDVLYLGLLAAFFLLCGLYAIGCEKL